jgi:hypothetical protein
MASCEISAAAMAAQWPTPLKPRYVRILIFKIMIAVIHIADKRASP